MSIKWNEQAETGRVQIDCQSLEQMTLILDKLGLSDENGKEDAHASFYAAEPINAGRANTILTGFVM